MAKMTKRSIGAIAPPIGRHQEFHWDSGRGAITGFGLRVTRGGAMSFIYEGRANGRSIRLTIGSAATWPVDRARREAQRLAVQMDQDIDPREEAARKRAASTTLAAHFNQYIRLRPLKERTRRDYSQYLERYFGDWRHRPLAAITEEEVKERYRKLADAHGPTQANISLRMLKAVFANAAAHEIISKNPVAALSRDHIWIPTQPRNDYLKRLEIGPFLDAVRQWPGVMVRLFVQFLLYTGCRFSEAKKLKWTDVDVRSRQLTFRDTKSRKAPNRTIPVTETVETIISCAKKNRPQDHNPYVFGTTAKNGGPTSIVDTRKCMGAAAKSARVNITPHGLRRTATTILVNTGASPSHFKRVIGHTLENDITEIFYVRLDCEHLRPCLDVLDAYLSNEATVSNP